MHVSRLVVLLAAVGVIAACKGPTPPPSTPPPPAPPAAEAAPLPAAATATARPRPARPSRDIRIGLDRDTFNRAVAALNEPLFWRADDDGDGSLDIPELAVLTGPGQPVAEDWARSGRFMPAFHVTLRRVQRFAEQGLPKGGDAAEQARREAVLKELEQGQPTLVHTDLREAPEHERKLVERMLRVARHIESIYARQRGVFAKDRDIDRADLVSRALFWRNQGPWCEAPSTESDPNCNALAGKPPRRSGLYPLPLQAEPKFCDLIAARKDADALMAPFVTLRADDKGVLSAVPYHLAWPDEHEAIARELDAAAGEMPAAEAALATYLRAAAKAFRTGDWFGADEAWAAMNAENSAFYLRVGPDETYFEPCSRKAGYHLSFARIDRTGLRWKQKLAPLRSALEAEVAEVAGPSYAAREVAFHLPEFIAIILNAGDSRSAHGATIGQSLPNFGPVAAESRGRTVAMANLYRDPDSIARRRAQAESLLCEPDAPLEGAAAENDAAMLSTVLHEAAHNLGPNGSYKVRVGGKPPRADDAIFGGPLAATLEELKAQTLALHLNAWLQGRGDLDAALGHRAWQHDVVWLFGQIAQGMRTPEGKPKPYPQLASVQLGRLSQAGALRWEAARKAANGKDVGCFVLDPVKLPAGARALAHDVLAAKAKGDRSAAERLVAPWVADKGEHAALRATIRERWLRTPKVTFVYSVTF